MMEKHCPHCNSIRIAAGRFFDPVAIRTQPAYAFFPDEVKEFSVSESRVVLRTSNRLDACLDCGFLWGSLKAGKLEKVLIRNGTDILKQRCFLGETNVSARQESVEQCPGCQSGRLCSGTLGDADQLAFRPTGLRFFTLYTSDITFQNTKGTSCIDCGLVFTRIDAKSIQDAILKHGKKAIIQRLQCQKYA